jgi:hypothetical protein
MEFTKAYVMSGDGSVIEEVHIDDILGLDSMTPDNIIDATQMLLSVINDCVDTYFPEDIVKEVPITSANSDAVEPASNAETEDTTDDESNEVEDSAVELTEGDTEVGSEEVDAEDTGLAGDNAGQDGDQDSPLGAA